MGWTWPVSPVSSLVARWWRAISGRRNSYTPDDIRARLHQRLAETEKQG